MGRTNNHKLPNRPSIDIVGGKGKEIVTERGLLEVLGGKIVVIFEKKILVHKDGNPIKPEEHKPYQLFSAPAAVHAEIKTQPKMVERNNQLKSVVTKEQPKPIEHKNQPKQVEKKVH